MIIDDDRLDAEGAEIEYTDGKITYTGQCVRRDEDGILIVTDEDKITYVLDVDVEKITYGIFG